jgi:hypothetical protein
MQCPLNAGLSGRRHREPEFESGEEVAQGWDKVTKEVEKYNAAQQKVSGKTSLSNKEGTISRNINTNADGNVVGYHDTYNYAKEEQDTQKLIESKAKLRQELARLGETGNVTAQQLANVAKVVNSVNNAEGIKTATQSVASLKETAQLAEQMAQGRERAALASAQAEEKANVAQQQAINRNAEITRQLTQQIQLYQRQAEIQANALMSNPHKVLNTEQMAGIQNYLNAVRALNAQTPQVSNKMKELSLNFKEISAQAQTLSHGAMSFGESLSTAMQKFPVWINHCPE